jgi:hypothetical protein
VKALTAIQLCAREYNDRLYERIAKTSASQANWLDWLNDGQRTIALVRPDASAITENITLVAGTKQSLPTGRTKLLAVTRNMGADGATPGKALRFAPREDQDAVNEDWHSVAQASPVRAVIYDDKKDPLVFWTTPPAVVGWEIEATMSAIPADVPVATVDTADISLQDVYGAPLQQWMLCRAYLLNTQSASNMARATGAFSAFFNLLGVKLRGELWTAALASPQLPARAAAGA